MFILRLIFIAFVLVSFASHGYSSEKDLRSPTLFLDLGGGFATYKSKLVKSNDTGVSTGYSLGMNGGDTFDVGASLRSESNTTAFEYGENNTTSSIQTTFQDLILGARYGFVYGGFTISQTQMKVKRYGVNYLDILGSGYGANVGMDFLIGRYGKIFLDTVFVATGQVKESVQDPSIKSAVGPRTDIYFGGMIPLTKSLLNMTFGYKMRTYSISVGGTSYAESQSVTWIGLSLNGYF